MKTIKTIWEWTVSIVFAVLFFVIVLIFSGCSPAPSYATDEYPIIPEVDVHENFVLDALYATMDVWAEVYGTPITPHCYDFALNTVVVEPRTREEMHARDGWAAGNYIFYNVDSSSDARAGILVHEWIHQLGWCQIGNPDNGHKNSKMFSCAGSVELLGSELIGTSYRSIYPCAIEQE